jgi:NAD(P)H-binding
VTGSRKVCIVGASGKLGQYMVQHALDRGYEVVGVCREQGVGKLDPFSDRITVIPGATDDREVVERAVQGCGGVLVVLVPRGVHGYSTGTTQAVLDYSRPGARLVFSCGSHITRDGKDVYSRKLKAIVRIAGPLARLARFADLDDQVEACRRIFQSDTRWTVVRGSDLEEGENRASPSGADTWATPSLRATSRAAWTSPCSWWRRSRTMNSSTRLRQSSADSHPRRLLTRTRRLADADTPPPSRVVGSWGLLAGNAGPASECLSLTRTHAHARAGAYTYARVRLHLRRRLPYDERAHLPSRMDSRPHARRGRDSPRPHTSRAGNASSTQSGGLNVPISR